MNRREAEGRGEERKEEGGRGDERRKGEKRLNERGKLRREEERSSDLRPPAAVMRERAGRAPTAVLTDLQSLPAASSHPPGCRCTLPYIRANASPPEPLRFTPAALISYVGQGLPSAPRRRRPANCIR